MNADACLRHASFPELISPVLDDIHLSSMRRAVRQTLIDRTWDDEPTHCLVSMTSASIPLLDWCENSAHCWAR